MPTLLSSHLGWQAFTFWIQAWRPHLVVWLSSWEDLLSPSVIWRNCEGTQSLHQSQAEPQVLMGWWHCHFCHPSTSSSHSSTSCCELAAQGGMGRSSGMYAFRHGWCITYYLVYRHERATSVWLLFRLWLNIDMFFYCNMHPMPVSTPISQVWSIVQLMSPISKTLMNGLHMVGQQMMSGMTSVLFMRIFMGTFLFCNCLHTQYWHIASVVHYDTDMYIVYNLSIANNFFFCPFGILWYKFLCYREVIHVLSELSENSELIELPEVFSSMKT